jgi:hypothetical protein
MRRVGVPGGDVGREEDVGDGKRNGRVVARVNGMDASLNDPGAHRTDIARLGRYVGN